MSGDYAAVLTRSVGVSRERLVSNEVQIVLENEFDLTLRPSTNQFRTNVTTEPIHIIEDPTSVNIPAVPTDC
jgi:hypothetical protein